MKVSFLITTILALPRQDVLGLEQEKRLISTKQGHQEWMTEAQIFQLYKDQIKFIDVTDGTFELLETLGKEPVHEFPKNCSQQVIVGQVLELIDTLKMTQFLTKFSSFHTRYFKSESGKKSSQWLFDQLSSLTPKNKNTKFTVEKFQHSWNQFSVIAKWSPVVQETQEIVILSAHQDSVNQWNPWFGRSPGADDDGSGTTTIFEAARVLLNSDFVPRKSIEFHFYSAEEGGLLGSQQVVKHYAQSKKKVVGVLHNDMTGYSPKDKTPVVAISTDNVDPELTKFLGLISNQYSGVPIAFTKCGYACSDHASWTKAKIPSCFTFEAKFEDQSPYIHSTGDTVEQIDFDHMKSFVNNCVGFVVELSLQE